MSTRQPTTSVLSTFVPLSGERPLEAAAGSATGAGSSGPLQDSRAIPMTTAPTSADAKPATATATCHAGLRSRSSKQVQPEKDADAGLPPTPSRPWSHATACPSCGLRDRRWSFRTRARDRRVRRMNEPRSNAKLSYPTRVLIVSLSTQGDQVRPLIEPPDYPSRVPRSSAWRVDAVDDGAKCSTGYGREAGPGTTSWGGNPSEEAPCRFHDVFGQ